MDSKKSISTTDLAKICGVSQGTVDRALNNRSGISAATKQRILDAAKKYNYRPNIHARSIAGGKSMLIGVVVFDLHNQYFSDILTSIECCCAAKGYSTVVMLTEKSANKEIKCIENLHHMSVDGIVLCPINRGEEFENFLLSLEIPIVTIGNCLEKIPYVGIDNTLAMQETVTYVKNKGYETVVYVSPPLHSSDNTFAQTERLDAFCKTAQKEHLQYVVADISDAEQAIVPGKKNALICPTNVYALRLIQVAEKHHAGIVGFDNMLLIDLLGIKLDSVSYDVDATAKAVVDYIIDNCELPVAIEHHIVERGSI